MKRSKKQLNAISRSYTEKAQKEARENLKTFGITYEQYVNAYGYKGSPCRLLTSLWRGDKKTTENVKKLHQLHS